MTLNSRLLTLCSSCLLVLVLLAACSGADADPLTDSPTDTPTSDPAEPNPEEDAPNQPAELLVGEVDVSVNPSGIAPLGALATFETRVPTTVELSVAGAQPISESFAEASTEHSLPILGLYPDTDNQVTLSLESAEGSQDVALTVATQALPDYLPEVEILEADKVRMEPGMTLSSLRVNGEPILPQPFAFDNDGAIRWYLDLADIGGRTAAFERLANGNLFFGYEENLYEYDMLGNEVNRWTLTDYTFHHDIVEKPDGNFILAADKTELDTIEDHIIEIERATGELLTVWDLREVLDVSRTNYDGNLKDWIHVNAVIYDESDDSIIVSGRDQAVFKVSRENELVWILAPQAGWGQAGVAGDGLDTNEYLLTAVDADGEPYAPQIQLGNESAASFDWPWGQHAPVLLPNGNLFLFDNGRRRNFDTEMDGGEYSRAVEYQINEENLSVEQVWSYGQERGNSFFSEIISDVDYLPETGNRLVMPGIVVPENDETYSVVSEVTTDKELVFDARIKFKNRFPTDTVRFKDSVYRSERLTLYP